jgi:hypothetical protein
MARQPAQARVAPGEAVTASESAPSQVSDPVIAGQPLAWWVLEVCKAWHDQRDFSPILHAIYSAANREGAIEATKAMCDWCARDDVPAAVVEDEEDGWWHHKPGYFSRECKAGPILDALLKLRKGGEEK